MGEAVRILILTAFVASLTAAQPLVTCSCRTAMAQENREGDRLVRDLVTLDEELEDISERLSGLERESEEISGKISETESEIAALRDELESKKEALSNRARSIYVNGRMSDLELLIASESLNDYLRRSEMLEEVTAGDAEMAIDIKNESERLDQSLAGLNEKKQEVEVLKGELESKRVRLEENRAEREELLASAGDRKQEIEESAHDVETKIDDINNTNPPTGEHTGRFVTMIATGYSPEEPGLDESTATGMRAQRGVVAVDPSFIPLGTRLHVEGYGYAIAGDTGSAIKGNRIDLCFDTLEEVEAYGRRTVQVEILD